MEHKGLLVVSFGTSYPETRKKNIEHLETLLAEAFPDRTFYRAYTSGMIRKKLWERDQILIPSVKEAAQAALEDGITDLLVQPTHIMNGIENDQMKEDILGLESHFNKISFGDPLISSTEDQFAVIEALMEELPCLSDQEALVFMGHGSTHHANTLYAALDYAFKQAGYPGVYVGTVEAYPDVQAVLAQLREKDIRRVYLTPFMLVAGDHASNDLAGEETDSWNSLFRAEGYETSCILKGLGEYDGICDLYVRHARQALL